MLIGIVADIHEAVVPLEQALSVFRRAGVEQVVSLGDAFDSFRPGGPAGKVANLLLEANTIGVWGNHDIGLSYEVTDEIRQNADPSLLSFSMKLEPQLVIDGCRFSHEEPWRDPRSLEDLWSFAGMPDTPARVRCCFDAVPEKFLFVGHFHHWLVMDAEQKVKWNGESPLQLDSGNRYLVAVAAAVNGWCATFDTARALLTPMQRSD